MFKAMLKLQFMGGIKITKCMCTFTSLGYRCGDVFEDPIKFYDSFLYITDSIFSSVKP